MKIRVRERKTHSWGGRFAKSETVPEKKFREFITGRVPHTVFQYYTPPELERSYEIDFAIPDLKLAFEINGEQHYSRDRSLAPYYQKRDDLFKSHGWTTIQIHYSLCFCDEKLAFLVDAAFDGRIVDIEQCNSEVMNYRFLIRELKFLENVLRTVDREIDRVNRLTSQRQVIERIVNTYGNGYGTVNKIQSELGLSSSHVRRLLNRFNIDVPKVNRCPRTGPDF